MIYIYTIGVRVRLKHGAEATIDYDVHALDLATAKVIAEQRARESGRDVVKALGSRKKVKAY